MCCVMLTTCAEKSHASAGIMEMGGASTQIAFAPTGNVLADKFPVRIGHELYSLYVHSYLDYGQNRVVQKIRRMVERQQSGASRVDNPCMMTGTIHRGRC